MPRNAKLLGMALTAVAATVAAGGLALADAHGGVDRVARTGAIPQPEWIGLHR